MSSSRSDMMKKTLAARKARRRKLQEIEARKNGLVGEKFGREEDQKRNLRVIVANFERSGVVPKLDLSKCPEIAKRRLRYKAGLRNLVVEEELQLKAHRQIIGRQEREKRVKAVTRIQALFRMRKEKVNVAKLVERIKQQLAEEESLARRLAEEKRRALDARRLFEQVNKMPDCEMKEVLLCLESFDDPFELSVSDSWNGAKVATFGALKTFTGMRKLAIHNVMFSNKPKQVHDSVTLGECLVHQERLVELSLVNCNLVSSDIKNILSKVRYGCSGVEKLDLSHNHLGRGKWERMDDYGRPVYSKCSEGSESIGDCFRSLKRLRYVDISRNGMQDSSLTAILSSRAFSGPKRNLVHLDLSWNQLTDKSAFSLSHVICSSVSLQTLRIGGNSIKDKGLRVLESSLALHHSLRELSLDKMDLTDSGVLILNQILNTNSGIQVLNISNNKIKAPGLSKLCDTVAKLRRDHQLARLDLSENPFLKDSVEELRSSSIAAIVHMIESCVPLKYLGLRGIELARPRKDVPMCRKRQGREILDEFSRIMDALCKDNTLQTVDLRNNQLESPACPPRFAYNLVESVSEARPGMFIPRERQHVVAQLFARLSSRPGVDTSKLAEPMMLVLAFDCDQRVILL